MSLKNIFNPSSIAVVGVSTRQKGVGFDIFTNLTTQGYKGLVYAINPKVGDTGKDKFYPSLTSLPHIPELAIIALPSPLVAKALIEAGENGVKSVIIISAGFREIGPVGEKLESQIKEIVTRYRLNLVGVNCLGAMNIQTGMNASFASRMPEFGNISFISQSGALCTAVIDFAKHLGLGFAKIISIGNKTSLSEIDILEYLETDPETKVIMMYVEDLSGKDFLARARKLTKPIVVLKTGQTAAGQLAANSHTGALGGSDLIYEALFRQAGIIRAYNIQDLFNYCEAFACNALPRGNNVAVLTNAGGPGGLTTDALSLNGLEMAELSNATKAELMENQINPHNPIDILGDAGSDKYATALDILTHAPEVDMLQVILTPQTSTQIEATAKAIVGIRNIINKPIITSFMGDTEIKPGVDILALNGVCDISYPDLASKALAKLYERKVYLDNLNHQQGPGSTSSFDHQIVTQIISQATSQNLTYLTEDQATRIFKSYNLPVSTQFLVTSVQEAIAKSKEFNSNLVLKIVSPDIVHKSDVGGVILDVAPAQVESSYSRLLQNIRSNSPQAKISGVLMSEMIDPQSGFEIIIGAKTEPGLGKSIMVGVGGTMVEVVNDVTFSLLPIGEDEAWKMLERLKSKLIFKGVRGRPALDEVALVDALLKVSQLLTDFTEIRELDINPILVLEKGRGCKILDARIILAK
jgi:acetyltransferase